MISQKLPCEPASEIFLLLVDVWQMHLLSKTHDGEACLASVCSPYSSDKVLNTLILGTNALSRPLSVQETCICVELYLFDDHGNKNCIP